MVRADISKRLAAARAQQIRVVARGGFVLVCISRNLLSRDFDGLS